MWLSPLNSVWNLRLFKCPGNHHMQWPVIEDHIRESCIYRRRYIGEVLSVGFQNKHVGQPKKSIRGLKIAASVSTVSVRYFVIAQLIGQVCYVLRPFTRIDGQISFQKQNKLLMATTFLWRLWEHDDCISRTCQPRTDDRLVQNVSWQNKAFPG